MDDTVCVKSRTGNIIMVDNCPIMWQYKLQSQTTLSAMETEIITIDYSCCELIPITDVVSVMDKAIGLTDGNITVQVSIHEDNAGALVHPKPYSII